MAVITEPGTDKESLEALNPHPDYSLPVEFTMMADCVDLRPIKSHPDDAGYDLKSRQELVLDPGRCIVVQTGLFLSMPARVEEYDATLDKYVSTTYLEAQVRSRSGNAAKHQVFVLNSPGTLDAGYRGEVGVILYNLGSKPFEIKRGDRIAQMVFNFVPRIDLQFISKIQFESQTTARGVGGFGSTGKQ